MAQIYFKINPKHKLIFILIYEILYLFALVILPFLEVRLFIVVWSTLGILLMYFLLKEIIKTSKTICKGIICKFCWIILLTCITMIAAYFLFLTMIFTSIMEIISDIVYYPDETPYKFIHNMKI